MRGGWVAAAAALALGLTVAATWPLGRYLDRTIVTPAPRCAGGCADARLALWAVTEGGRRLVADPRDVYDAPVFRPLRHALAFSESGLALGALAAPANAVSGNPLVGFNLVYLASYALTGLGVFLVVRRLTGAPAAALLALVMAVSAPERVAARPDLFALATLWLPFLLHATLLCLDRPSGLRALWLASVVVLFAHSRALHLPVLPILLAPWLLGLLLARRASVPAWAVTVVALAIGGAVAAACYGPRYEAWEEIAPVAMATSTVERWGRGMLADLLAARNGAVRPHLIAPSHALLLVLVAAAALVGRGRSTRVLAATLASAAAAAWLPLRTVGSVFLAVAAGHAFATVLARARGRTVAALAAVTLVLVGAAEWHVSGDRVPLTPMPEVVDPPRVYRWLARTPPDTTVLELPAGDPEDESTYMVHALSHRRALANGYAASGLRVPMLSSFPEPAAIVALVDAGVDFVLLHEDRLSERQRKLRRLTARGDLEYERVGRTRVVRIPDVPAPEASALGPVIPREAWHLATGQHAVADGDLATHWRVASPYPEDAIEIQFEGVWVLTGVSLELGPHLLGYPPEWLVRGGLKKPKWRRLGQGSGMGPPLRSYRADHRRVTMPLPIRAAAVQYVRISLEFSPGVVDVHEVTLYGTQIGGPPPAAAPAAN